MPFVLDTSVTLSWHFEDEISEFADWVLDPLGHDTAIVPAIWPLEVANGLIVAERRGRITPEKFARAVELTSNLPLEVVEVSVERAMGNVTALARTHRLTAYDASFLDLAISRNLPLATIDTDLLDATRRVGLPELRP